jgi:Tfp pilus assembly protein PilX
MIILFQVPLLSVVFCLLCSLVCSFTHPLHTGTGTGTSTGTYQRQRRKDVMSDDDIKFAPAAAAARLRHGDVTMNTSNVAKNSSKNEFKKQSKSSKELSIINVVELHGVCVDINKDKVTARYSGKGNHSQDFGTCRANKHTPIHTAMQYFEVTIIDGGFSG